MCWGSAVGECRPRSPPMRRSVPRTPSRSQASRSAGPRASPCSTSPGSRRSAAASSPSVRGCSFHGPRPSRLRSTRSMHSRHPQPRNRSVWISAPAAERSPSRWPPRCRTPLSTAWRSRREPSSGRSRTSAASTTRVRSSSTSRTRFPSSTARSTSSSPTLPTFLWVRFRATPRCASTTPRSPSTAATTGWMWCARSQRPPSGFFTPAAPLCSSTANCRPRPSPSC